MLHVVTACSRPENLYALAENLAAISDKILPVHWWVGMDGRKVKTVSNNVVEAVLRCHSSDVFTMDGDITGAPQKNEALRRIANLPPTDRDWVYFLDDDNLIHDSLPALLRDCPTDNVILCPQFTKADQCLRTVCFPKVGDIDLAQFVIPAKWCHESAFSLNDYESDWHYLNELCKFGDPPRSGRSWHWKEYVTTYYNALPTPMP